MVRNLNQLIPKRFFSFQCTRTIDAEGPAILKMLAKDIDAKKVCTTLGVCSGSSTFENVNYSLNIALNSFCSF